jgi:WD40 repeat protein
MDGPYAHAFRRPTTATFSADLSLLAIACRGQDILLWDLENEAMYDTYSKDAGARFGRRISTATVSDLVFSTAPETTLLAATYSDGDVVLFDTSEGIAREKRTVNAQTLACSPDGRTLAIGDSSGTIQIFDFETLKVLYRIKSDDYSMKSLAFSGDCHRLLDIRGYYLRVWDPPVLLRQDMDDELSDTLSVSTTPMEVTSKEPEEVTLVTALACHGNGDVFFCGKEDGSVHLYDSKSGQESQKLFSHAQDVEWLVFDDESQTLTSADSSSRVMTHKLVRQMKEWRTGDALLDHRVGVAIVQVLANQGNSHLLVSSAEQDTLWLLTPHGSTIVTSLSWKARGRFRWASHPTNQTTLLLVTDKVAHLYEWSTLQRLTDAVGILLEGINLPEPSMRSIAPCFDGSILATTFAESTSACSKSKLLLFNTPELIPQSKSATPLPRYQARADQVESLLGPHGQRLVFLYSNGWVCSAGIETFSIEGYARHFFIPADW